MDPAEEKRKEKFCVLYAHFYGLTNVETYQELSADLIAMFSELDYKAIVKPLICRDRLTKGLSWEFLSTRYCLPQATIRRLVPCCSDQNPVTSDKAKGRK